MFVSGKNIVTKIDKYIVIEQIYHAFLHAEILVNLVPFKTVHREWFRIGAGSQTCKTNLVWHSLLYASVYSFKSRQNFANS